VDRFRSTMIIEFWLCASWLLRCELFSLFQSLCEDLANSCHGSSECSTSPRVWQLLAKLTYLTWPICDRVEENFICCGEFSISGGGLGLLLNFCMPLVEMCMWFLIVVHPIPSNMVVFSAFLFRWIDLDQHRYLNFGCAPLGC